MPHMSAALHGRPYYSDFFDCYIEGPLTENPKIAGTVSPSGSGDLKSPSLPPGCQGSSKSGFGGDEPSQCRDFFPLTE